MSELEDDIRRIVREEIAAAQGSAAVVRSLRDVEGDFWYEHPDGAVSFVQWGDGEAVDPHAYPHLQRRSKAEMSAAHGPFTEEA